MKYFIIIAGLFLAGCNSGQKKEMIMPVIKSYALIYHDSTGQYYCDTVDWKYKYDSLILNKTQ